MLKLILKMAKKSLTKNIIFKTRFVFLFILLICILIFFKIILIQTIQGKKWRELASENSLKYRPLKAGRGDIYSSDYNIFATSLPYFKLAIDPYIINEKILNKNIDKLSYRLSSFFKDNPPVFYKEKILNTRRKKKRYIVLNNRKINYFEKKQISQWPIFSLGKNKGGIILEFQEKRMMPYKNTAKRTIGFINQNYKGAGIEYSFDSFLRGKDGRALFQKTTGGWKLVDNNTNTILPIDGLNIQTTIDTTIQDISEYYLKEALTESQADHGWVIILKVKTGEILSLVNLSRNEDGSYTEKYNYAIGKQRDPGSTFKIVSMMALLDKTDLSLDDTVDTEEGVYNFYDKKIRDWSWRRGGFGIITLRDVIERSSNIGISKLVQNAFGHDPSIFVDYIKSTGITQQLNFQILGEAKPYIKKPSQKSWSGITLSWMSHGYEIEFAPIHIVAFYNAIANNGRFIRPIIIKKVINKNNKTIKKFTTNILKNQICTPRTLKQIQSLLEGVVEKGGAQRIKRGIYKIAGKSGTAQIHKGGKYKRNSWYVSFVGYFPKDTPKYTCLVGIENPKGFKQYGSDMAAPVLRKIADKIAIYDKENLIVPKENKKNNFVNSSLPCIKGGKKDDIFFICKKLNLKYNIDSKSEWIKTAADQKNMIVGKDLNMNQKIPNLIGLTLKDCIYILESKKIDYKISEIGNRVKMMKVIKNDENDSQFKLELICY